MTQNLKYSLSANTTATGSYNNGTTFTFTPTTCANNGNCMLNGQTYKESDTLGWTYSAYAASAGKLSSNGSVCPAGWILPGYGGTKSYDGLLGKYIDLSKAPNVGAQSISKITSWPISLGPAGLSYASAVYIPDSDYQASLWYGSDFLYTLAGSSLYLGKFIRCVNR